nr:PREDICTED: keratin-associated protein 5-4-like [Linepithema humile]XP_012230224.1 PREDICTED: keratin-associated protein 5-4-like [Linepithema humile]
MSSSQNQLSVRRSLQDHGCCGGSTPGPNESCAFSSDAQNCAVRCCYHCPQICKKAARCDAPSCAIDVQSCGGCRGRKPGQICTAPPRTYNSPAHSSRGRSPCAPRCPLPSSCPASSCGSCCSGIYECGRSRSPRCQSTVSSGYCINNGTKCGTDGACCRLRLLCECLGGGLDCRRCGRKVYQAEMQIASGVPYHSICFSCFCCRKPLEPLTYQENCGEIYCKQCYVRNFGPQGYGYGAGAGVLQTPL